MDVTKGVALANARLQNARAASANSDLSILRRDLSMTCLRQSTFALGNVVVCSSVALISARSSVIRAHVERVAKPSLTRSAAAAAEPFSIHHFPAARNLHHAAILARGRRHVATLRYLTTVTKTTRLVLNARFLWRNAACAGRRPSKTSNVGCRMFVVARFVATSFAADHTPAASLATAQESAKMRMARLASNLAESPRRFVATLMRICVMLLSLARKTSPARARSSSPASARHKSKR